MTNETIPTSADFRLTREPSKAARERILSRAGIGGIDDPLQGGCPGAATWCSFRA